MALTIWDIYDRAQTGPLTEESEFDKHILPKEAARLVKEYDIKYDPEEIVSSDDTLADDIWKASVDLFLNVGVYCCDSNRLIKISEDELTEIIRNKALSQFSIGEGADAKIVAHRKVEDQRPLIVCGEPVGTAVSEDIALGLIQAYAKESIDMISPPVIDVINGRTVVIDSPIEIQAVRYETLWAREAIKRANKPGLHIVGGVTAQTAAAAHAAFYPRGLRKTDAILTCPLAELKIDYRCFSKLLYGFDYGSFISISPCPVMGTVGGPEITVLIAVAEALQAITHFYSKKTYVNDCQTDLKYTCSTRRECLWIQNLAGMAISRNASFLYGNCGTYCAAGPSTKMALYETAAKTIGDVVSGRAMSHGPATCAGVRKNYVTPLESRMIVEVNRAVAGVKRNSANEIVKILLTKYEKKLENPPLGKSFKECYNLKTLEPSKDYVKLYNEVKRELQDLGLEF